MKMVNSSTTDPDLSTAGTKMSSVTMLAGSTMSKFMASSVASYHPSTLERIANDVRFNNYSLTSSLLGVARSVPDVTSSVLDVTSSVLDVTSSVLNVTSSLLNVMSSVPDMTSLLPDIISLMPNMTSSVPEYFDLVKQPLHMIIIYSVAYLVVFMLGVVGNSLVVTVVWRNPQMHSVTNYFIVNLAIADILVALFCLPITLLSNLFSGWRLGAVMCKLAPFLQGVSVCASVSTLAAISVDRYLAICRTLQIRLTRKVARLIIICIWTFASIIISPWAVFYHQHDMSTSVQEIFVCGPSWPSEQLRKGYFLGVIFLACYTVPLLLISICYFLICYRVWHREAAGLTTSSAVINRSKVKVLKMLIVVVILFAFSWLPLYVVNMRLNFGVEMTETDGPEFDLVMQTVIPIAQWLGLANSCVNPIVYCLFSRKYRIGIRQLIVCCKAVHQSTTRGATYGMVSDCRPRLSYGLRRKFERRNEMVDFSGDTSIC